MVFYILDVSNVRYYYKNMAVAKSKTKIPYQKKDTPIKCDIISYSSDRCHPLVEVKMYFENKTIHGYLYYMPTFPFKLMNEMELFDGRFNLAS